MRPTRIFGYVAQFNLGNLRTHNLFTLCTFNLSSISVYEYSCSFLQFQKAGLTSKLGQHEFKLTSYTMKENFSELSCTTSNQPVNFLSKTRKKLSICPQIVSLSTPT